MTLAFLDTETTGLDPAIHQPWEVAYALDDGPIVRVALPHTLDQADPDALHIGGYHRCPGGDKMPHAGVLDQLRIALAGVTLVGANPGFDEAMLRRTLGGTPWSYRKLDVTTAVMYLEGWDQPKGLLGCAYAMRNRGIQVPMPDHTAAGDVATVRAIHRALRSLMSRRR